MQLRPRPQKPAGAVPRDPIEPRTMESSGLRAISKGIERNISQRPARKANSRKLPALKKRSPTSRRAIRPIRRVGGAFPVDTPAVHDGASRGGERHSRLALPEAVQRDLPAPRGAQSHDSPDMAGGAGASGNTEFFQESRLESQYHEKKVGSESRFSPHSFPLHL